MKLLGLKPLNKKSILLQHIHRLVVTALELLAYAAAGLRSSLVNEFSSSNYNSFNFSDVTYLLLIVLFFNFMYWFACIDANIDLYIGMRERMFVS